ncbi:MAG TPA: sensor histidine kinase [Candidatus Angelobacter sp.]|nr:sensor histidine kinase [Candidatus Angelobacter sp.]
MSHPRLRIVLLLLWSIGTAGWTAAQSPQLPVLTSVDQVRRLTPDKAQLGYPVRIRGVITDDVPKPDFFVQDGTAGIYVEGDRSLWSSHVFGDFVEVEGVTGPGRFAPVIRERRLRVLGRKPLPKTHIYAFHELADGQKDSQWVQVRGIVRSVSIDRTSWPEPVLAMNVSSGGSQFSVRTPLGASQDISSWVDKEVLIQGVCGTLFNAERQLVGILFYVPRLEFIRLEAPSNEVPFAALMRFSAERPVGNKVRVRGVVAYQQAGNVVFLESGAKGLRVLAQQDTPVHAGDIVDALGFPAVGESEPVLADAVFRVIGQGPIPQPINLDLNAPWGRYDGALVTTDARLIHLELQPYGASLLLQHGATVFEARLQPADPNDLRVSVPPGSELRVTGICLVRAGGIWHSPESFRLLLRSRGDITVLRTPSWWNLRHTVWVLAATGTILVLVIAWVVVLGRRLREQMALIRQKLRGNAVLEERNRIARELHDTLEQELAGITIQLDLAADCFQQSPNLARGAIDMARNMSRHSMIEARRSVWDLRCHLLENGDLVSALSQAIQSMVTLDQAKIRVQIQGEPYRLAPEVEMNLLRIGQEAVANALTHAGARNILVELRYGSDKLCLHVIDDGCGFTPGDPVFISRGHFGLLDMRERAQSLGCHLQIDSEPGRGTHLQVEVSAETKQLSLPSR